MYFKKLIASTNSQNYPEESYSNPTQEIKQIYLSKIPSNLPRMIEISDMVKSVLKDTGLFKTLKGPRLIKEFFDENIRKNAGIPDFKETPGLSASVIELLDVCKDKTVLMFGEQHQLQISYFFTANILPTLINYGFKTVVCEALPWDFHTEKYQRDRKNLYKKGEVSLQYTPLIFNALTKAKDFYSFKLMIDTCAKNKVQLFGANITEDMFQYIDIQGKEAADFITRQLKSTLSNITQGTKTIFYTGALHNDYRTMHNLGIRDEVDQKFGKDQVISIDISDINYMTMDYAFEQYDIFKKSNVKELPAAIFLENNINADCLLVLKYPINFDFFSDLISFAKNKGYLVEIDILQDKCLIKKQDELVGEIFINRVSKKPCVNINPQADDLLQYLSSIRNN